MKRLLQLPWPSINGGKNGWSFTRRYPHTDERMQQQKSNNHLHIYSARFCAYSGLCDRFSLNSNITLAKQFTLMKCLITPTIIATTIDTQKSQMEPFGTSAIFGSLWKRYTRSTSTNPMIDMTTKVARHTFSQNLAASVEDDSFIDSSFALSWCSPFIGGLFSLGREMLSRCFTRESFSPFVKFFCDIAVDEAVFAVKHSIFNFDRS